VIYKYKNQTSKLELIIKKPYDCRGFYAINDVKQIHLVSLEHFAEQNLLRAQDYYNHMANGALWNLSGQLPCICSTGVVHSNVLDLQGF
jgi:hypothetical protein